MSVVKIDFYYNVVSISISYTECDWNNGEMLPREWKHRGWFGVAWARVKKRLTLQMIHSADHISGRSIFIAINKLENLFASNGGGGGTAPFVKINIAWGIHTWQMGVQQVRCLAICHIPSSPASLSLPPFHYTRWNFFKLLLTWRNIDWRKCWQIKGRNIENTRWNHTDENWVMCVNKMCSE